MPLVCGRSAGHWLDARADGEDDGHVPDAVWDDAVGQFHEHELAQLVFAITSIKTWNRLMITARAQPGHYRPGMFA